MALNISDLFTPATNDQWTTKLLAWGTQLGLSTTSWQSGSISRTILALAAAGLAAGDALISQMAQGGFLDYAATGTVSYSILGVTYTAYVTPDPSISVQNSTGKAGWLDLLADSVYNVQRIQATYATTTIAITNSSSQSYGPLSTGTYHVGNPITGATYSNTASLTIAPKNIVGGTITGATNATPIVITTSGAHGLGSGAVVNVGGVPVNTNANGTWVVTVLSGTTFSLVGSSGNGTGSGFTAASIVNVCTIATVQADANGVGSSSGVGTITQPVTSLVGVSLTNTTTATGTNYESNTALAARCRAKLGSLSPNGAAGAYSYFALTAPAILASRTPAVVLSNPPNRVLQETLGAFGVVTVYVAGANGAITGVSEMPITGATNATPIVITTSLPHGLPTGSYVNVSGVIGNTNANGDFTITSLSGTTFSLVGSSGNAAYAGGGVLEGGDLGEIDSVLKQYATPDGVAESTVASPATTITIAVTVYVPSSLVSTYRSNVIAALANYMNTYPIGGPTISGANGYLLFSDVTGLIYDAGVTILGQPSYVQNVVGLTVNGGTSDVYITPEGIPVLAANPTITVIGT